MSNNKKFIPAVLLLSVFALLLSLEVMVTPVFCCKDNGAADLELTVMGMACGCIVSHYHGDPPESGAAVHCSTDCGFNSCLDLPQDSSWLERNVSSNNFQLDGFKQVSGIDQVQPEEAGLLPRRVPLTLLNNFPAFASHPSDGVVLRC